ncbi:M73 family metallopeptidase [Brevibacillus composti]|uniref:Uncharacterized protein n=1 Tax=Brevibacillus composti TaxID=2796470 RepID=A0A7T5ELM2_9BACL|nr:hypothetical protein [Brevibacillus composti]QQE74840.1 hypothetical protein JD108_02310 [Brevibacillus composti]
MSLARYKVWMLLSLLIVLVLGLFTGGATLGALRDSTGEGKIIFTAGELGIAVENEEIRFTEATGTVSLPIDRLAPGDRGTETFQLRNHKAADLKYEIRGGVANGPIPFTGVDPAQDLRVSYAYSTDQGKTWISITPGTRDIFLAAKEIHYYKINYQIPLSADNRYQQASGALQLVFHAESLQQQAGCFLPPFANNQFALHQGSAVPIKFQLKDVKPHPEGDVRLEITGPAVGGGTVSYTFSRENGTLDRNGNHYQAGFSTRDYPVVTDGVYKAVVYTGSTAVCGKEFAVRQQGNRAN